MNAKGQMTYNDVANLKCWQETPIDGSAAWQQPTPFADQQQKIPAWLFVADGLRLMTKAPVEVVIRREGEVFFAECPELHIFADGDAPDTARHCLDQQVIYFYQRYTGLADDQVTGLANDLRSIYRKRFKLSES